jgi:signal transduction histidine kinase/PAS domain-containing protein
MFLAVVAILVYGQAETRQAHAGVTRTLELEENVTSLRVWINRGSTDALASILEAELGSEESRTGDEARTRAELVHLRTHFAGDPGQLARVDELAGIIAERLEIEGRAAEAARRGGTAAARDVLTASTWSRGRARVRTITAAMLADVRRERQLGEEHYDAAIRRATVAFAGAMALMIGTFLFLLNQLRVTQRGREEADRARNLVRERLSDLAGVLDTVPAAVLICRDREGRWLEGNRFAGELFRVASGHNFSQSAPPGERPSARYLKDGAPVPPDTLPVQVAAREGVAIDGAALELILDDGTVRHVVGKARPLLDASGAPRGAVGAFVDVTETVRSAHDLAATLAENRRLLAASSRSQLLYREMARNFPNGSIGLFDHDLRFLIFGGTQVALKRDPETTVGRTLAEVLPPEVVAKIEPVHRDALRGVEGRVEVVIEGRTLVIRTRPVRDETGAVIMGIAMSQDVTEQRALRAQVALSSRLASLGTLVAGVAHEVNNPLAGTIASVASAIDEQRTIAARIRDGEPIDRDRLARAADAVVEILLDAQLGAGRISQIVKDLLLFGRPNPMRTRVLLGDVATASMRWLPASVGRAATVKIDDLGAPAVHASAGQLEQVVVNLVNNAAFAIPAERRGEVSIRIFTSASGWAALEVRDDGRGIDAGTIERIFDPFFTTRDVGQGMGLGLPICHVIVSAHGGTLTAESVVGQGSTFRVELPPAETVE